MLFPSFFGQTDNYRVVGRYSEPRSAPPGFAVQAILLRSPDVTAVGASYTRPQDFGRGASDHTQDSLGDRRHTYFARETVANAKTADAFVIAAICK